jgi:hypothetical protein
LTKLQRLTDALLADRLEVLSRHNIIPCFVCGHTFVYKGHRRGVNGRFCSLRCQDWYDVGNAPITYRWRDDMQKTADGFKISCAHCRKDFESKGLRCCSSECEHSHREREANLAVMAQAGIEAKAKRRCDCCGAVIPTWRNGRKVSSATRFCSPKCAQKTRKAA